MTQEYEKPSPKTPAEEKLIEAVDKVREAYKSPMEFKLPLTMLTEVAYRNAENKGSWLQLFKEMTNYKPTIPRISPEYMDKAIENLENLLGKEQASNLVKRLQK